MTNRKAINTHARTNRLPTIIANQGRCAVHKTGVASSNANVTLQGQLR